MTQQHNSLQTLISSLVSEGAKAASSSDGASFVKRLQVMREEVLASAKANKAVLEFKALGISAPAFVADAAATLASISYLQTVLAAASRQVWLEETLGQSKVNSYVDLWGRLRSLECLLVDLIGDFSGLPNSKQIMARAEVLMEGLKQSQLETSQALLAQLKLAEVMPVVEWSLKALTGQNIDGFRHSILKEMQGL